MKTFKKNNKGFSLVELIVVIAIMAVLGVAIALAVTKFIPQSQRSTDISNATMIAEGIEVAVNDFATSPDGKINGKTKADVFGTASGGVYTVSLSNLAATGLIKSEPTIQGSSSTKTIYADKKFKVSYTESTGKVVVKIADDVDLMDSEIALKYKNDTWS